MVSETIRCAKTGSLPDVRNRPTAQWGGPGDDGLVAAALIGQHGVGRRLEAALQTPLPRLVLLAGEGGIGKTAHLDVAAGRAAERGWVVRRAVARADGTLPAWSWWQAFPAAVEAVSPPASVASVYAAVRRAVGEHDRLLMTLDDVQWADRLSLEVLRLLVETPDLPLLVLAALRAESAPRTGAIADELHALASRADQVPVEALDEQETAALFELESGNPPLPVLERDVWRATAGNPYLVRQLARSQRQIGNIHRPDLSTGFRIPAGVAEILRDQLGLLSATTRSVMRAAAVAGETFDARLLIAVVGHPRRVVDALDDALRQNVARESAVPGTYAFRHAMLREALHDELGPDERRRLHGRMADVLARAPEPSAQAIAHHRFKELDPSKAEQVVRLLVAAADEAASSGDLASAARHRRRAAKVASVFDVPLETSGTAPASLPTRPSGGRAEAVPAVLVREGDVWRVAFGDTSLRLRDSLGLGHLATLVAAPGREFHCLELTGGDDPRASALAAESPLPTLDGPALAAYRHRLSELREDLDEAESFHDDGRAERLRDEVEFLTGELASATGLGGRVRSAPAASERARVSVTRAVRTTLDRIATELPRLGEHLRACVHTGTFVSYTPVDRSVAWTVQR